MWWRQDGTQWGSTGTTYLGGLLRPLAARPCVCMPAMLLLCVRNNHNCVFANECLEFFAGRIDLLCARRHTLCVGLAHVAHALDLPHRCSPLVPLLETRDVILIAASAKAECK